VQEGRKPRLRKLLADPSPERPGRGNLRLLGAELVGFARELDVVLASFAIPIIIFMMLSVHGKCLNGEVGD